MKLQFVFRHIAPSLYLQNYAFQRLNREVAPLVEGSGRIVFSHEGAAMAARCYVRGRRGVAAVAANLGEDAYSAFDGALEKLRRQLKRKRDRRRSH